MVGGTLEVRGLPCFSPPALAGMPSVTPPKPPIDPNPNSNPHTHSHSTAAFLTYSGMGYPLTASVAFPALALFNLLRFPVMMFPQQVCLFVGFVLLCS